MIIDNYERTYSAPPEPIGSSTDDADYDEYDEAEQYEYGTIGWLVANPDQKEDEPTWKENIINNVL